MILGLGSDIVNISRIQKLFKNHPKRSLVRLLHSEEIQDFRKINGANTVAQATFLARRFAAKEACVKALGTGFRKGIRFTDIRVSHDSLGKPILTLYAKAKEVLDLKINKNCVAQLDISIADDFPLAQSIVILSSVAKG